MLIICLFTLFLSSCSFFERGRQDDGFVHTAGRNDYIEHLGLILTDYINSPYIRMVTLDRESRQYLEELYGKVISNKSLVLDKNIQPRFYIVKDKRVFFFSLPEGGFFFSTGVFAKYFRNEEVLVSAFFT